MRSVHRFFAPNLDPGDEAVTLPRDEAEHLTRVLRLAAGDTVSVFDGRGNEFVARVVRADRRDARVQIVARMDQAAAAEPGVALTLVQAVLKGEKLDDIVRDAVMLGVTAIQPLVTTRAETTVAALTRQASMLAAWRWRRWAIGAGGPAGIRRPLTLETYLGDPLTGVDADACQARCRRRRRTALDAAHVPGPQKGNSRRTGRRLDRTEWTTARPWRQLVTLGRRTSGPTPCRSRRSACFSSLGRFVRTANHEGAKNTKSIPCG